MVDMPNITEYYKISRILYKPAGCLVLCVQHKMHEMSGNANTLTIFINSITIYLTVCVCEWLKIGFTLSQQIGYFAIVFPLRCSCRRYNPIATLK